MSIKKRELISSIEEIYRPEVQEEWDNCGWQIDLVPTDGEVSSALVTLEITGATVREALETGVDLIVEHHPMFFGKIANIDASGASPNRTGEYAVALIQAGVSVYAAHTNFDSVDGGMNDALAGAFGLADVKGFPTPPETGQDQASGKWSRAMGRRGVAPEPCPFANFIASSEGFFGMRGRLKYVGDPEAQVRTVALCGGAGGDFVPDAIRENIDLYITSDVKHHEAQWAKEKGLMLIDGGHWGTEKLFVTIMGEFLRWRFNGAIRVVESRVNCDPWA
jgi:dinuclear metal center YbgI/SA1388 family protein